MKPPIPISRAWTPPEPTPDGYECLAEVEIEDGNQKFLVHVKSLSGLVWQDAIFGEPVQDSIDGAELTGRFFPMPRGY